MMFGQQNDRTKQEVEMLLIKLIGPKTARTIRTMPHSVTSLCDSTNLRQSKKTTIAIAGLSPEMALCLTFDCIVLWVL